MSRFVLIPGAGGAGWYWYLVVPGLQARGHEAVAIDLPGADPTAGLPEYAAAVRAAMEGSDDVVVVAQSLGGFTAAITCAGTPARLLVLVNAMIPRPGETPGQWWEATGQSAARIAAAGAGGYSTDFDLATYFLHDVPAEVVEAGKDEQRPEADIVFGQPCAIDRWPDVPTRVLAGRADRFFPLDFQRQVAADRLGLDVDVVPGGHLVALSQPEALTDRLVSYL
jgi:pimeloyl-ACP methyl ester carboxylesterase